MLMNPKPCLHKKSKLIKYLMIYGKLMKSEFSQYNYAIFYFLKIKFGISYRKGAKEKPSFVTT